MKTFVFLIISLTVFSCTQPEKSSQETEVVKKMFGAFNNHDWVAMAKCYSDTALFLDPSFGVEYVLKTREETVAKYAELHDLFPDIKDEVKEMYTSGDHVIVEFISTGKAADGMTLNLPIISVLTVKDGVIIKDATYYDTAMP